MDRIRLLSGNALKIIAAATMLTDHIGMLLFPTVAIFRIIGRIAFPIFAFMIAEGARYTRDKLRYFLCIFGLGAVCQVALAIYNDKASLNVLITFSVSILLIYALQLFKKAVFLPGSPIVRVILSGALLVGLGVAAYFLNSFIRMEYGFVGCMLPFFASLPDMPASAPEALRRFDNLSARVILTLAGTLLLSICSMDSDIQIFSLLAIPLLFMYSGKRGRLRMKYFFYIFYPTHLLILAGISMIVN